MTTETIMSIEQKAKAYDEALKRAEAAIDIAADKDLVKGVAITIFPELAESKDERIRKWIYNCIDSLGYPADEDAEKELEEMQPLALAWLEKQKESHKSADFIPSDCVSDAKCENRWHKVADSFPDSAREVICKDAIGNFFIGRYYKGSGSWEVSMYDDVDKSNEDNPPVIMWCDIPSEKQKEPDWTWTEEDDAKVKAMCKEGDLKPSEKTWLKELKNRIVKKEQKPETKLTRWVARDENGEIYAYEDYPEKDSEMWIGNNSMLLDRKSFPDLKYEDEPVEVEITIKKK